MSTCWNVRPNPPASVRVEMAATARTGISTSDIASCAPASATACRHRSPMAATPFLGACVPQSSLLPLSVLCRASSLPGTWECVASGVKTLEATTSSNRSPPLGAHGPRALPCTCRRVVQAWMPAPGLLPCHLCGTTAAHTRVDRLPVPGGCNGVIHHGACDAGRGSVHFLCVRPGCDPDDAPS